MGLTREEQITQLANLLRLRARMCRTRRTSYLAQGESPRHPELEGALRSARTEEELAAILVRYGVKP